MSRHRTASGDSVHTPYRRIFANAAARTGDSNTYITGDLYCKALQLDTGAEYYLSALTPTWSPLSSAHGDQPGGSLHSVATTSVAGFMSATDKQKVDLISLATTMKMVLPIDGHSSNSEADQGFNNGHTSIIMRGASPTTDPEVRWARPFGVPGYTSGTGVVKILFTTNVSGAASENVIWRFGWRYADDGDDMDPPNDEYSNNGAFSHDVSAVVEDTMTMVTIDTISASEMAELAAADIAFFRLSRESQSNANDDFNQDVYVHGIWIEYAGNFIAPGVFVA